MTSRPCFGLCLIMPPSYQAMAPTLRNRLKRVQLAREVEVCACRQHRCMRIWCRLPACQIVRSCRNGRVTQSTVSQARGGSRWHRALTGVPNLAGSEVAAEPWLRGHSADLPSLPCSAGLWPARQPADKLSDAGTTARAGRGRNSVQISALARPFHQVCMQSLPVMEHQRRGC